MPAVHIHIRVDTIYSYLYLLQQGFDLFGLIESGQAIDYKITIKK